MRDREGFIRTTAEMGDWEISPRDRRLQTSGAAPFQEAGERHRAGAAVPHGKRTGYLGGKVQRP
jgi:hypothetical protein